MHLRILSILFFCFSLLSSIVAQAKHFNFSIQRISSSNGMSSDLVNDIFQDSDGYLWFVTDDGLNRYDGYSVTVYKSDNQKESTFNTNKFNSICEDNHGNLWLGTESSGINIFNKFTGEVEVLSTNESSRLVLIDNSISNLFKDHKGNIWIAFMNGLMMYDVEKDKLISYSNKRPLANSEFYQLHVFDIFEDKNNDIWVGAINRGIGRYSPETQKWEFYSIKVPGVQNKRNWCRAVFQDREGSMWFGTWGFGFLRAKHIGKKRMTFESYTKEEKANRYVDGMIYSSFNQDEFGNLWAGGPEGIDLLLKHENGYRALHNPIPFIGDKDFSKSTITKIFKDRSGILWVSTLGRGVYKIDTKELLFRSFTFHPEQLKVNNNAVYSFSEYNENEILVGLKSNGFGVYNFETKNYTSYTDIATFNTIENTINTLRVVQKDDKGRYWLGTRYNGVYLVDLAAQRINYFSSEKTKVLPVRFVNDIFIDSKNDAWIASDSGAYKMEETKDFVFERYKYSKTEGMPSDLIETIYEDSNGEIWFGTEDVGLVKVNFTDDNHTPENYETYSFERNNKSSISNNKVISIFEDDEHNFWIGTEGGGLNLFDRETKTFRAFTELDGLYGDAVYAIIQDGDGYIWISTNNGLYRFMHDAQSVSHFENFTVNDGLQGNIFIKGACLKMADNKLLFGGHNGFNYFDSRQIKIDTFIPPVKISNISVLNNSIDLDFKDGKGLVLNHKERSFSIEFTALSFSHSEKNSYAYMLEGYDADWQFTNASSRRAYYSNLPQGRYVFKVKGANNSGIWNPNPEELSITVLPSPFLSWWAYVIYFIIILFLFYLVYRFFNFRTGLLHKIELEKVERNRIEKLNLFKLRFFTNISHELLTPLSIISCSIEELSRNDDKNKSNIGVMMNNVNRLVRLIRQLLDFRKIETENMKLKVSCGDLASFIQEAVSYFGPLIDKNKIDFKLAFDGDFSNVYFDVDKIDKVLHNLLSNAFKFTPVKGEIKVSLQKKCINDSNYGIIKVSDTGKGISKEKLDNIFERYYRADDQSHMGTGIGLALTKGLVEVHNGDIKVNSELDLGTEFVIEIPIDKDAYLDSQIVESIPSHPFSEMNEVFEFDEQEITEVEIDDQMQKAKTVLLIEDNEDYRMTLAKALKRKFNVIQATNGLDGYQKCIKHVPDLVISDVMMPEMDGFKFCEKLKQTLEISHIPVILLTAKTGSESRSEGYDVGADSYLSKPVNISVLESRVSGLLEQRERLQRSFQVKIDLEPEKVHLPSLDEKFIRKAKALVEQNIDNEEFSVHVLVKEMGTSNSMLYRKLSSITGMSPNEFIKNIRLKRASQLLSENKFTISEVAYATGFHDQSYFSVCFKKHFGMTPTEFLNKS